MSYIRFNRHSTAALDGWVWDCFISPSGEINGDLHHFAMKKHQVFHKLMTPNFFVTFDRLLDQLPIRNNVTETKGMVIVRLRNENKAYYSLLPLHECPNESAECAIWKLVNSIFEGTGYL